MDDWKPLVRSHCPYIPILPYELGIPREHPPPLRPDDWNSNIDWVSGTVGPYSSVLIKRASIEAWLGTKPAAPALAFKKASDAMVLKAIREEYDRAKSMNEKPQNAQEIIEPVQGHR